MSKSILHKLKFFLAPILLPFTFYLSINGEGFWAYHSLAIFFWVALFDLIFPKSLGNPISKEEEKDLGNSIIFDVLVLIVLPIQLICLTTFLIVFYQNHETISFITKIGWISAMAVNSGILGINVGHELGHRIGSWQRYVGKALLWTSLRMSFYIEHNWGHHRDVSTPKDPASAKKNEWVYTFVPKSLFLSWFNSWSIQKELLKKRKVGFLSIYNDVLFYTIIQWSSIIAVFFIFDWQTTIAYISAMVGGMVLLELVNYIEHYGLSRKQDENGRYEKTLPIHSWNSDHSFSGAALFNLSRHSDHHHIPGKAYQTLKNYESAPNMPAGYSGMLLLSLISPLWFWIMNKKVEAIEAERN